MPEENKDVGGYKYTRPRGPVAAMYNSPGPIYSLPPLVGYTKHDKRSTHPIGPAHSFGLMTKLHKIHDSPGPAAYAQNSKMNHHGKDGAPHYSLGQRLFYDKKKEIPGPGAYAPEKHTNSIWKREPAYTFGLKPELKHMAHTPGPGQYTLRSPDKSGSIPTAPAYTMCGRGKPLNIYGDTPGPAAYNASHLDAYLPSNPKYTMASKAEPPPYKGTVPGPGAYRPEKNMYSSIPRPPNFTFGMKHSPYKGEYIVEPKEDD